MAKKKLSIDFSGFGELAEKIVKASGDLKATTEKALNATYDIVTPQLQEGIRRHKRTGRTEKSLKPKKIVWEGNTAYVYIGFSVKEGGLASIFINYGTPKVAPDPFITKAVQTKKKLYQEKQKEIFEKELEKLGG